MKKTRVFSLMTGSLVMVIMLSCSNPTTLLTEKIVLDKNWRVQQSGIINNIPGSVVSGNVLDLSGWYAASVPSTIMGVLTENGLYADLFMGDSIKRIDEQQFEKSWWYRTEFTLPELKGEQHVMLHFDGISYYANIWLNSKLVASRDTVFGTFRTFVFDITSLVKDSNILAVEIFKAGDFGHGLLTGTTPPDDNMGLWRPVYENCVAIITPS
jgi:exo-1,4-beta-D-glucosaminidase